MSTNDKHHNPAFFKSSIKRESGQNKQVSEMNTCKMMRSDYFLLTEHDETQEDCGQC